MTGIFLTQEGKQGIEAKIAELENDRQSWLNSTIKNIGNPNYDSLMDSINQAKAEQASYLLQEILYSATILPVEESWRKCGIVNREERESVTSDYPNGVIIQPKQ
jgi:hypothetical protein